MRYSKLIYATFLLCFGFNACAPEYKDDVVKVTKEEEKAEPVVQAKVTDTTYFTNDINNYGSAHGAVGVFHVPEMLVLSILDSASSKEMSDKLVKSYSLLEEDMNTIRAEKNGPIGMLTYNNDLNNFVFESVLFIRKIPKIQPKHSKIVILEASEMLVYNFYGSYENLFAAYNKIKQYCDKNDLIQTGPMREFYLTDPAKEKDKSKWLTRIMLPVISMHKKPSS